jgi:isocitrate dehydrogenase kinase/phosphatase
MPADPAAASRPAAIAFAILEGFNRHYRLFRYVAQQAKGRFENGDWQGMRDSARERIDFYDTRVREAVARIEGEFALAAMGAEAREALWPGVKAAYVSLLAEHRQPECAETFFNSVSTKLLHREYFNNAFIFVRPGVATEYMDSDPPSYRCYYPATEGLRATLRRTLLDFGLACGWEDFERDCRRLLRAVVEAHRAGEAFHRPWHAEPDCQVQVLSTLFFRNKAAYVVARLVNGTRLTPMAVPIQRNARGRLYLDTALFTTDLLATIFSFTRAYFLVDMEAPSAYVDFLRTLLPHKPASELYTMVGLQKQGKTLFYRDFLHHLRHSHDQFTIAPGIKGLVMTVFTLPSYPYVFKIIKDVIPHPKETDREQVMGKYQLVKMHDRVGRMADTWEYSQVALPRARCAPALLRELLDLCPSQLELTADTVVIDHLYIERRMTPLNLFLQHATDAELEHAIREYGQAIKDLAAANIFPGDMLYKNFGVTRLNRVVFYDYDEIEYMTDCNFRDLPQPGSLDDDWSGEITSFVDRRDMFPAHWRPFLTGDPRIRAALLKHHDDLFDPDFWRSRQARIRRGIVEDVYPYPAERQFGIRYSENESAARFSPPPPAGEG